MLARQIAEFHPRYAAVADPDAYDKLEAMLAGQPDAPKLLKGPEGLRALAAMDGPGRGAQRRGGHCGAGGVAGRR